jgi:uncharacterized protein (TIGR02246 family)
MKHALVLFLSLVVAIPVSADTVTVARMHSEAFARAMNAKDIDAVLAFYAEDARVIWPGRSDEARGKTAIRALIASTLRSFPKDSRLELQSQDAIALADGYIATVSHWEQSYARNDGTRTATLYRATEVIRSNGKESLYVVDHASLGLPPADTRESTGAAPSRQLRSYSFVECDKYQVGVSQYSITPGDVPGHKYSLRIWRHNYTTTDPEYGEAETTVFQVSDDVFGAGTNFGTAVDRLANGESIYWQFRGTHQTNPKDGTSSFEGAGTIVGGTGTYKNAKGHENYRGKASRAGCKTEGEAQWGY